MVRYEAVGHASCSRWMAWGPALRSASRGEVVICTRMKMNSLQPFPQTQRLFLGLLSQKCCLASLPKIIAATTAKGFFGWLSLSAARDQCHTHTHTPAVPAVSSLSTVSSRFHRWVGNSTVTELTVFSPKPIFPVVFLLFYKYVISNFFSSWVHFLFP